MQNSPNDSIVFLVVTSLLVLILVTFIVAILYLYKKKQVLYIQNLETIKSDYEKTLLKSHLEIQEQTLNNIAREIHDNISLSLTLSKLYLNTIDWQLAADGKGKVVHSIEHLSYAIEELTRLSHSLNADYIAANGLVSTLQSELEKIRKLGLFEVRFEMTGEPVFLDNNTEVVVFRMTQEALQNTIKHAQASCLELTLSYNPSYLQVIIRDNGKGIGIEKKGSGSGLANMQHRAQLISGYCTVESEVEKGTRIELQIPYAKAEQPAEAISS